MPRLRRLNPLERIRKRFKFNDRTLGTTRKVLNVVKDTVGPFFPHVQGTLAGLDHIILCFEEIFLQISHTSHLFLTLEF